MTTQNTVRSIADRSQGSRKLFVVMLGGRPPESTIEQHNIYCGVGESLEALYLAIKRFWSTAPHIHIDAYMEVAQVGNHRIMPVPRDGAAPVPDDARQLFLIGLGGYRTGVFAELHKYVLLVASDLDEAKRVAKQDPFMLEGLDEGERRAAPHIDSKKLLDVFEDDGAFDLSDAARRQGYSLTLEETDTVSYPEPVITGYLLI
jgi:hypothetical protein